MALMDDVKVALRVKSDATDPEIRSLINAALSDMERVGVGSEYLDELSIDPIAKSAVILFCKARYGYDNSEASRFEESYRQTVIDLINSDRCQR